MSATVGQVTRPVDVDASFSYECEVTKSWQDPTSGKRYLRGVASGILEDRDGERVSARAIRKMAAQPVGNGQVKITSGHDQDWLTEFGDVVKLEHDAEHDELLVECELPPEGEDPIADKAWKTANSRPLGFSIGGKLKKAFYELADRGGRVVKRKVLDEVQLAHVALTRKPSYAPSFAEAVAKTWDAGAPDLDDEEAWVAKARDDDDPDNEPEGQPEGEPEGESGPPAASADVAPEGEDPEGEDPEEEGAEPTDAEAAQDLPMARHLACPNCGHEFAAPLSADPPENRDQETTPDQDTTKSVQEPPSIMATPTPITLDDALAKVRAIADEPTAPEGEGVVKTTEPAATEPPASLENIAGTLVPAEETEVGKMVAAVHRESESRVAKLEAEVAAGFGEVVKAVQGLAAQLTERPAGRKSIARTGEGLPPRADVVAKQSGDVEEEVAKAETPLDALKALNRHRFGG